VATHYDVLKVKKSASGDEIKGSFRRLAKKFHPDSNPSREKWAHDKMLRLLEAYSVLKDELKRGAYDRSLPGVRDRELRRSYWERLKRREGAAAAGAKMVLFELLQEERKAALKLYEKLAAGDPPFNLMDHLSIPDYLDCKFLLAEAYQYEGDLETALRLYREVYLADKRCSYYHHFAGEIKDRITRICCRLLPRMRSPREALDCFEKMGDISFPKKDRAFFYKKIAESYASAGDAQTAKFYLARALSIYPHLAGIKKLRRKLEEDQGRLSSGRTK